MKIRKKFGVQSFNWGLITGHKVGGGALFITMKAAQWCLEAKKALFLSYENI